MIYIPTLLFKYIIELYNEDEDAAILIKTSDLVVRRQIRIVLSTLPLFVPFKLRRVYFQSNIGYFTSFGFFRAYKLRANINISESSRILFTPVNQSDRVFLFRGLIRSLDSLAVILIDYTYSITVLAVLFRSRIVLGGITKRYREALYPEDIRISRYDFIQFFIDSKDLSLPRYGVLTYCLSYTGIQCVHRSCQITVDMWRYITVKPQIPIIGSAEEGETGLDFVFRVKKPELDEPELDEQELDEQEIEEEIEEDYLDQGIDSFREEFFISTRLESDRMGLGIKIINYLYSLIEMGGNISNYISCGWLLVILILIRGLLEYIKKKS